MLADHIMVIAFKEDKPVTIVYPIIDNSFSVDSPEYEQMIKEIFQHTVEQNPDYQNQEYFMMPKSMLPTDHIHRDAWRMKDGKLVVDETKIKAKDGG